MPLMGSIISPFSKNNQLSKGYVKWNEIVEATGYTNQEVSYAASLLHIWFKYI
jgi:hypothetical protein